jgi:hypothetical protein
VHALGLSTFLRYLTYHAPEPTLVIRLGLTEDHEASSKERRLYIAYAFTVYVGLPLTAWITGYIAHRFM